MKYMLVLPLSSDTFEERTARFLETGGLPPDGVTMHGRWHALGVDQVFVLAESDDPKAVYRWAAQWADLIDFEIVPVLDDADAAEVLQELRG